MLTGVISIVVAVLQVVELQVVTLQLPSAQIDSPDANTRRSPAIARWRRRWSIGVTCPTAVAVRLDKKQQRVCDGLEASVSPTPERSTSMSFALRPRSGVFRTMAYRRTRSGSSH